MRAIARACPERRTDHGTGASGPVVGRGRARCRPLCHLSVHENNGDTELPEGAVVCFTGALEWTLGGTTITRERARALAEAAGLETVNSVTRKCEVLVVADPHSQSAKARKARELGVRVIAESAFWPLIGVDVN